MSKTRACDRCGKLYSVGVYHTVVDLGDKTWNRPNYPNTIFITDTIHKKHNLKDKYYDEFDLCPECSEDFNNFLKRADNTDYNEEA